MDLGLSTESLAIGAFVMFVASTVQCSLGMGGALIAAPILAFYFPTLLPAPLIINGAFMTFAVLLRERQQVLWPTMQVILPSALIGIATGGLLLSMFSTAAYTVFIGIAVISAALLIASGWNIAFNKRNSLIAGSLCGFMHATVSLPGPPIMLLFRNEPARVFRPTLAAYLLITSLLSLAMLYAVDRLGMLEFKLALAILPGTVLGYIVSFAFIGKIQDNPIKNVVLAFAFASGCVLLAHV
jgi:uncharacterized membrane protein YfcA